MGLNRRQFLYSLSTSRMWLSSREATALVSSKVSVPNPEILKSGDLVWPKKLERSSLTIQAHPMIPALMKLSGKKNEIASSHKWARSSLSHAPGKLNEYAIFPTANSFEVDSAGTVIEALLDTGVIRHNYREWIASRPDGPGSNNRAIRVASQ